MEYSIGRFSELTGIPASTLRYYESEGLLCVARNEAACRRYSPGDVEWVRFIKRLKETGMPIRRIREYARLRAQGDGTMQKRMQMLREHHAYVRMQQQLWEEHMRKLEEKISFYDQKIREQGR